METMAQRKVWTIHTSIMNQPSLHRLSNVPQTKVVKEALTPISLSAASSYDPDDAAGELEFGAFYAETGAAPGTAPGDLQHGGV